MKERQLALSHQEVGVNTQTEEHLPDITPSTRTLEEQVQQDSTAPTTNEQFEEQGTTRKRQRGRTHMQNVHARTERKLIVLNEFNQPIGPTKEVVTELGSFLGTLARNQNLCPLNVFDWRKIDRKDDLWEYTKGKYDIPDAAKKWTLQAIQNAWRSHKSRLKKEHFDAYENDAMRMENKPAHVTESVFRELLRYWKSEKLQKISKTNMENRKKLRNPHTVGKKSFAMVRCELEKDKDGSDPITLKDIFAKTRERKAGRSYKVSDEDTTSIIAEMEKVEMQQSQDGTEPINAFTSVMGPEHPGRLRLYGRAVTKSTLKGKLGQFESFSTAASNQESIMEEMLQRRVDEKLEEQRTALRQEVLADVLSQLRRSGYQVDLDMLATPQDTNQPIHRPSVGSKNQGRKNSENCRDPYLIPEAEPTRPPGDENEREVDESSEELDLT